MFHLLHHGFHCSVHQYSDRVAIIDEYTNSTSYKQLNRKANVFHHIIQEIDKQDPVQNRFIGILSHVHSLSIAAIVGILKAKKTYVPMDVYYSPNQLNRLLLNLPLHVIIIDKFFLEKWQALFMQWGIKHIICFDHAATIAWYVCQDGVYRQHPIAAHDGMDQAETENQVADDLAYVLHTSGSTGFPKGIMLTHRNATTFVHWMQQEFKLTAADRIMARAPLKFDLSVFDIFNTLSVGATLICYDWNTKREGEQKHRDYVTLLEREHATILYTTPSTLITLMEKGGLFAKANSLHTILYAGEPFPVAKLAKLKKLASSVNIANIYGPTETNIITYHWVRQEDLQQDHIPLGKVVDDTEIEVIDEESCTRCAPYEVGELWCRGGTVTLGYINQPALTEACSVTSPFHPYPAQFWKTGDLGYRDEQGLLHYQGRKDHLYKIKGYRVEIGEIEAAIAKLPMIHESCVTIVQQDDTAIIVCHYSVLPGASFDEAQAQAFLTHELQFYMIPACFLLHPEIAKTSSGKVDRVYLHHYAVTHLNASSSR